MSAVELANLAMELSAEERLELARRLVESVVTPSSLNSDVEEGIRRIEEVITGKVQGLTEAEFRSVLG